MSISLVSSPEPRWGVPDMRAATYRLLAFAGSPGGAKVARLLEHLDYAWVTYVRTLQLEAERALEEGACGPYCRDVYNFIDLYVTDPFRDAVRAFLTLVPGPDGWTRELPDLGDAAVELEATLRGIRILSLGADHPDFPISLRFPVRLAATGLLSWYSQFRELNDELEELIRDIVHGRADFGAYFGLARPRGARRVGARAASALWS